MRVLLVHQSTLEVRDVVVERGIRRAQGHPEVLLVLFHAEVVLAHNAAGKFLRRLDVRVSGGEFCTLAVGVLHHHIHGPWRIGRSRECDLRREHVRDGSARVTEGNGRAGNEVRADDEDLRATQVRSRIRLDSRNGGSGRGGWGRRRRGRGATTRTTATGDEEEDEAHDHREGGEVLLDAGEHVREHGTLL